MNRRRFILSTPSAAVVLGLIACSDKTAETAAAAPAASAASAAAALGAREAYEAASRASGFTVGTLMAANTVYVFFDPTCPHCAQLWMNAKPLVSKLKVVWIPVGWLQRQSGPQGATLLSAPDPVAAMNEHEASVLEHKGGITVNTSAGDEVLGKVKANTELFNRLGAESVPFIVYRNARTGVYGTHAGAVSAEELAGMVGLAG